MALTTTTKKRAECKSVKNHLMSHVKKK